MCIGSRGKHLAGVYIIFPCKYAIQKNMTDLITSYEQLKNPQIQKLICVFFNLQDFVGQLQVWNLNLSSQKENVVLKYINNQQFLSLKELSLFPNRAKVVVPSSSLPSTRTGYAAAPFKCFLYSPQQSPSIHSPYPPLLFLFFLLFITVTVCILNLRLALAAFLF